jgi:hypothetical protein
MKCFPHVTEISILQYYRIVTTESKITIKQHVLKQIKNMFQDFICEGKICHVWTLKVKMYN